MNNRIKRKICAVGLAAFLLVSVSAAGNAVCKDADVSVSAAEVDESFEYEDRGYDELTLIGYKGSEKNAVIPREINGKKVVEIDSDAFMNTEITSVMIPDTVRFIGDGTFSYSRTLAYVEVDAGNENYSSYDGIVYNKKGTILLCCPSGREKDVVILKGTKYIISYAFDCCTKIKSVTMPDTLLSISSCAFNECLSLSSITIPASVTEISDSSFDVSNDLVIYCEAGSYADTYAKENGIKAVYYAVEALSNKSSVSAKEIVYGDTVKVSCNAEGGKNPYTYAVYYKQSTATKWTTAQKYSENREVSFKPKHTGIYNVCIRAKDSDGHVTKKIFNITVNPTLKNTSEVSVNSIKLGKGVKVTAASTGGLGEKVYEVFYKNSTQTKWTKAQSYSSNTSITIKPKHTGKYTICVKAKDERGKAVKKNLTVEVTK